MRVSLAKVMRSIELLNSLASTVVSVTEFCVSVEYLQCRTVPTVNV